MVQHGCCEYWFAFIKSCYERPESKLCVHLSQGQRKKKLEAKKVREQIEEEKRKQMDLEEANYREEKRKEAVQKAELQLYHQTDRVKGLHVSIYLVC